ncbi:regulatory protein GemA [Hungatella effluvii]|uniref:regulatory protein GemA n=1 Tax=Hungatella effluvii TaxID=1096246 RepID=UPI0022E02B33|nr:regulatory protein GemA [Hungatella effluvii]
MGTYHRRPKASIRTIWGIAKSPELGLSEDDLYAFIYRETGREHMRDLTQGELDQVARVLGNLKYKAQKPQNGTQARRTDEGGNPRTAAQRRKIYMLCEELGWNDNPARIHGFVKKVCNVERLEWLSVWQCSQVIEALKEMAERKQEDGKKINAHQQGAPGTGQAAPGAEGKGDTSTG